MGLDWPDGPKTTAGGYEPTKTRAILLDVEVLGDILASNSDPTTTRQSVSLTVDSERGTVTTDPWGDVPAALVGNELRRMNVERLQLAGRPRVSWPHVRLLFAWAVPFVAAALWVWLALLAPMPLPAHLLAAGVMATGAYLVFRWSKAARVAADRATRAFRYRAFSRETTWRLRADRRADLRIALLSIAGTLAAAVVTAYLTGLFG